MHPHFAKTFVGIQDHLEGGPRLTYLPDSVYEKEDWKRKPNTLPKQSEGPQINWVQWLFEKIENLFRGGVL